MIKENKKNKERKKSMIKETEEEVESSRPSRRWKKRSSLLRSVVETKFSPLLWSLLSVLGWKDAKKDEKKWMRDDENRPNDSPFKWAVGLTYCESQWYHCESQWVGFWAVLMLQEVSSAEWMVAHAVTSLLDAGEASLAAGTPIKIRLVAWSSESRPFGSKCPIHL